MKEIRIRKLEDHVVQALRGRAKRNGHSLEGELRVLLTEEALRPKREFVESLRKFQEELGQQYGELPDSTPHIRALRDGNE